MKSMHPHTPQWTSSQMLFSFETGMQYSMIPTLLTWQLIFVCMLPSLQSPPPSSHCAFSGLSNTSEWYLSKSHGLQVHTSGKSKVYTTYTLQSCTSLHSATMYQSLSVNCKYLFRPLSYRILHAVPAGSGSVQKEEQEGKEVLLQSELWSVNISWWVGMEAQYPYHFHRFHPVQHWYKYFTVSTKTSMLNSTPTYVMLFSRLVVQY